MSLFPCSFLLFVILFKSKMNIDERLIENPLFFKWVYHSTPEIEDYWKSYMMLNPQEAEHIVHFKKEFDKLRYSTEKFPEEEKKALALKILRQMDLIDKQHNHRKVLITMMRYAAIAVLFFAAGSSVVYLQMRDQERNYFAQNFEIPVHSQEPVLILDNKDQIRLEKKESVLDYSKKDGIIVNGDELMSLSGKEAPKMNQLIIPYGNRSRIQLSDGTTVWLNAGSRLIYPSKFAGKRREIFLSGEAFFDVFKNPDQPFIVKTNDLYIRVLGTRFNVSAYPEDATVQTVLEEGAVAFHSDESNWSVKNLELKPNQLAVYNKGRKDTKIYEVNAGFYSSWTKGLLSFEDANLYGILKKLERSYNVRFHLDDPAKRSMEISGKLDLTQGLDEAFEYIERVAGIKFNHINGNAYEIK